MRLHNLLSADYRQHQVLLTSRGTSALYVALRTLREQGQIGDVIVPATVCPSVPMAVVYAGFNPVFCDVEPSTFSVSARTIRPHLNSKIVAVLVVHLFGKVVDCKAIRKLGSFILIEDIAQAVGGWVGGKKVGEEGDFTVMSFDPVKIIKGQGGALLVKNEADFLLAEKIQKTLPFVSAARRLTLHESFEKEFRQYRLERRKKHYAPTLAFTRSFHEKYRRLFVHKPGSRNFFDKALKSYLYQNHDVRLRRKNYQRFVAHLRKKISFVRFSSKENCWRLPILLADGNSRDSLVQDMRSYGILISDHYFPMSVLYGKKAGPTAKRIGMCAVNLWVDGKTNAAQIKRVAWAINALF